MATIAMTGRLSCVALIAAAIAVVHGAGPGDKGEWRYYSADNHATKYLASRSDHPRQCRAAARRVAPAAGRPGVARRESRASRLEPVHGHAHHGRRRALYA